MSLLVQSNFSILYMKQVYILLVKNFYEASVSSDRFFWFLYLAQWAEME